MVQRVTYRRRLSYNTNSNRVKIVKTPGGKLVYHHLKKPVKAPRCAITGEALSGLKAIRSARLAKLTNTHKSVSRAYGGCMSAQTVRDRIVRAFLIEEQKIVKKVIKAQGKK